ncbi:hypothetical protein DVH24_040697 [Malus domestica]|uniref:Uncharacterized protein n=1 Tax=Malus domestica TaxID=3750 RepID=A0A498I8T0_MALDO|nr:hypothetical protein DVH24_040697 [Malus domestica]
MALANAAALKFSTSAFLDLRSATSIFQIQPMQQTGRTSFSVKPFVMRARGNARTDSTKTRNRRMQKKVIITARPKTEEAAKRLSEEFVKACNELNIHEISSYDRNGFATGERIQAFEIAISQHGFLSR